MSETRWYVLHAYSGYEKKVSSTIVEQADKLGISELNRRGICTYSKCCRG